MDRGKNGEHQPNIKDLSGDQLEILRKALKINKDIAAGLLKKWLGGGSDNKQEMDIEPRRNTESQ